MQMFCISSLFVQKAKLDVYLTLLTRMSSVVFNVSIMIQYDPPVGETLRPPNYRAATSVSLRCEAEGATGSVSYQWSSTCSGCFVSGTSQTVSCDRLGSSDAGEHSCLVTDLSGGAGKASTVMNIGELIHY